MAHIFKLLSVLPLWLLHGMGWVLGWCIFLFSGEYRRRFLGNAALAGVSPKAWQAAVGAAGKLVAELPRLWMGKPVAVQWAGTQHIEHALAAAHGVLFLTPHMGSFELAARAFADTYGQAGHPVTVLFRPPRQAWLRALVEGARHRPGLETAPTTLVGVRRLFKALKQGQCVAMLPDQVPPLGQGIWAPFFGREAYTMTLSAKLALQTGATVLLVWSQRLSWGRGYVVHTMPLGVALSPDVDEAVRQINGAMETLVRQGPEQYLWGYARYKSPRKDA
jgi:KDO2-lipid IV(A) lauroyltransferase